MSKSVFCLVDSEVQAEAIVDNLKAANFSNNEISVLFPDKSGTRDFAHEQHTKAPEGAATGAGARIPIATSAATAIAASANSSSSSSSSSPRRRCSLHD